MTADQGQIEPGTLDAGEGMAPQRIVIERYDMAMGPVLHLAAERERLRALSYDSFEIIPVGTTLGGEILGVDLASGLTGAVVADIRQALVDFKVVFFRRQPLTTDQHMAFARSFGDLEIHPFFKANTDHPELARLEKSAAVGGFENIWSHDVTWCEIPSMGAILRAVEVPMTGGDTLFADMAAAYDGLDDETKDQVDGLHAVHDYMGAFGMGVPEEQRDAMRAKYPPVRHPVIRTHPESGRKLIYVNRIFTSHIEALEPDESVALIDHLARQAEIVEYQHRFRWEPGSVAFWDNRCVQHYAVSDYWPDPRIMERASIVGDRPI